LQIADGVYRITTCYPEFEGIPLYTPLVVGSAGVALVDAAIPASVDRDIVPFLARLGLTPSDLSSVVVTHGHPDHVGGIARLLELNPHLEILCSEVERPWIEQHGQMYDELFLGFPGDLELPDETRSYVLDQLCGPDIRTTRVVAPGDVVDLGDRSLRVIDASGHSSGHIALLEESTETLLTADASQGSGVGYTAASQALPPLYVDAALYCRTQDRLSSIGARTLVSAHHEHVRGTAVSEFLASSAHFVQRNAEIVAGIVRKAGEPLGLGEIASRLGSSLSVIESQAYVGSLQLLCASRAHVEELVEAGILRVDESNLWVAV
jgi:glyoxylase-like metal-dependent hydrolase (beta-lactamase superfamily II)